MIRFIKIDDIDDDNHLSDSLILMRFNTQDIDESMNFV